MIKDEIKNIKQSPKDLRKFGLTVGTVIFLFGCLLLWKHKPSQFYFLSIGAALILLGLIFPVILRPLNKIWMILAILLGWIMTRVILSLLFYIVITPIGLIARISGKHFLDLKIDKSRTSYWDKRKNVQVSPADYERQF
ncbi:MAG: SxtJ family membrane protein [Ignavibacteriaceae bacterium]|nr:SxtJ family membrane protein [Ignavibacteriaceae bacterium]